MKVNRKRRPMRNGSKRNHRPQQNKKRRVFLFSGGIVFLFPHSPPPHLFPFITSIFSFLLFLLDNFVCFCCIRSKQTDTQRRRKTPLCPLGDVLFVSNKLDLPPHQKIKNSQTKQKNELNETSTSKRLVGS